MVKEEPKAKSEVKVKRVKAQDGTAKKLPVKASAKKPAPKKTTNKLKKKKR